MKIKLLKAILVILIILMFTSPSASATYYDPARPDNPTNKPTIWAPFTDPQVKQVAGPGDGAHTDNPNKTFKTYNAYDFAKVDANGVYMTFDVVASAPGTVRYMTDTGYVLGRQSGCPVDVDPNTAQNQGKGIFIDHGNGWQTFYFHLATITVPDGSTIETAGTIIGTAGCTGTGVIHLHYDLRWYDSETQKTWSYPVEFATTPPLSDFPLDLAFMIDTTGSMGDDIYAVKIAANEIVDIIKDATSNSRIALVSFRDYPSRTGSPGDYPYKDILGFTYDANEAKAAINSLSLGNGGDWRETQYCALMHTMFSVDCVGTWPTSSIGPWRAIPYKVIIYLTDAPPLSPEPYTGYTGPYVVTQALMGGFMLWGGESGLEEPEPQPAIAIYPVIVGGDPSALSYALELADATGGTVFTAATASEVAGAIIDAIEEIIIPPSPPPTCDSASPSIGRLWPITNKFVPVQLLNIENADIITIDSIFQDELVGDNIDAVIQTNGSFRLRAQRDGIGDGRVYHVMFSATGPGGTCSNEVKIIVPHDLGIGQRARGTAGDGGPLYNSTIP